MSHHGLTRNPNENPVSAGKVREAVCNSLRELGDRLKQKIDHILSTNAFAGDRHYNFLTEDGQIKIQFDLDDLANEDRTDEEREKGEGYYFVPKIVKNYIEKYYGSLGWAVEFDGRRDAYMSLLVGPISKELV